MELPTALVADLKDLVLDATSHVEITDTLALLATELRSAVPSFLGLRLTLHRLDQPIELTLLESATTLDAVRTSLTLPLADTPPDELCDTLACFGSTPGAFVDLAADLSFALDLPDDLLLMDLVLRDESKRLSTTASGLSGVSELALLDRAVGVLTERGLDPEAALAQLRREAADQQITPHARAKLVLDDVTRHDRSD